jgi:hypothetical protein
MDYFIEKNSVLLCMVTAALALWAFLVFEEELKGHWGRLAPLGKTVPDMEWQKEQAQHLAFYGGGIGYFFGGQFVFGKVLAVVFTVVCLWLSLVLKANIKQKEERERTVHDASERKKVGD